MIEKIIIKRQTYESMIQLAKKCQPKIICGFIIGRIEDNRIFIDDFYVLPTISGPKIHFKPNWKAYREGQQYIKENLKKEIVGEFHTHPDGVEELSVNDRKILNRLGKGFWVIVTTQKVVPWYFEVIIDEFKSVIEKLRLEIQ
ncbi:MAG: Mov34/MPN/PAD-1 family protein [Candidatus Aenigmatarchaeota archaeon]